MLLSVENDFMKPKDFTDQRIRIVDCHVIVIFSKHAFHDFEFVLTYGFEHEITV